MNNINELSDREIVDFVVITAIQEEHVALKSCFDIDFKQVNRDGVVYNIGVMRHEERELRIATLQALEMGPIHAAIQAARAILTWRPLSVFMTGVCAGVKNATRKGDLVFANQVYDHGAGAYVNGATKRSMRSLSQEYWIIQFVKTVLGDGCVLEDVGECYARPDGQEGKSRVHFGAMASGSVVVKDPDYMEELLELAPTTRGLDMESFSVASAATLCTTGFAETSWFVVKGIVDYGDLDKDDDWHEYCAFASARLVKLVLARILINDRSYRLFQSKRCG